jgi:hypothetical protein
MCGNIRCSWNDSYFHEASTISQPRRQQYWKVGSGAYNCSSTIVSTVALYKLCSESTEDDGCELHIDKSSKNENILMRCRIVDTLKKEDNLEDIIVGFILARKLKSWKMTTYMTTKHSPFS